MVVAGRPELPDELKATEVELREVSGLLDLMLGRFERIVRLSS